MSSLFLRRSNAGKNDDVFAYLRNNVRGQTAYQISAAIFAETKEPLKDHKYRQLQRMKLEQSPYSVDCTKLTNHEDEDEEC